MHSAGPSRQRQPGNEPSGGANLATPIGTKTWTDGFELKPGLTAGDQRSSAGVGGGGAVYSIFSQYLARSMPHREKHRSDLLALRPSERSGQFFEVPMRKTPGPRMDLGRRITAD
jgi:hypothetical protein